MVHKRISSIIVFLLVQQLVFAQQNTDGKFIFKTWFFLERENENFRSGNKFETKDSSLFIFLNHVIDLNIDTLKSRGFSNNYIFLSIAQYKKDTLFNHDAIIYKNYESTPDKDIHVGIPINYCDGYVLCVNKKNGRSFRLRGFYGNDIVTLFKDIMEDQKSSHRKQESIKHILKYYVVEGLDLKCIYRGVTSGSNDTKKYPCLIRCDNLHVGF